VAGIARPAIGGKLADSAMEPMSQPHSALDERALAIVEEVRACADLTDPEAVVGHLASRGLGFLQCIVAVRQLLGIGLGDAKILVHGSTAFAQDHEARQRFWEDLYAAAKRDLAQ